MKLTVIYNWWLVLIRIFSSNLDDMEPFHQIQFLKDCASLVKLKYHKNLIEFLGYCKSNNWLYLIFEEPRQYLKNVLFNSRTTKAMHPTSLTTLSELFVLKMLCEISSAMEFISNQQVIS